MRALTTGAHAGVALCALRPPAQLWYAPRATPHTHTTNGGTLLRSSQYAPNYIGRPGLGHDQQGNSRITARRIRGNWRRGRQNTKKIGGIGGIGKMRRCPQPGRSKDRPGDAKRGGNITKRGRANRAPAPMRGRPTHRPTHRRGSRADAGPTPGGGRAGVGQ
eukprot:gene25732-biopygen1482